MNCLFIDSDSLTKKKKSGRFLYFYCCINFYSNILHPLMWSFNLGFEKLSVLKSESCLLENSVSFYNLFVSKVMTLRFFFGGGVTRPLKQQNKLLNKCIIIIKSLSNWYFFFLKFESEWEYETLETSWKPTLHRMGFQAAEGWNRVSRTWIWTIYNQILLYLKIITIINSLITLNLNIQRKFTKDFNCLLY